MDIPIYNIVFNQDLEGEGLYGISIVDSPANQSEFIALNKDKIQLKVENKEKQLVTGVVLIPNQLILRRDKTFGEHYITFKEEVIEGLSHQFFRDEKLKSGWIDHDHSKPLDNSTVVESWIINSTDKDKAFTLGFEDLPVGTWMISMKLSDKDWKEYVKTGKARGFSIDGLLRKELELKEEIINNDKKEINMFKKFFNLKKDSKVELATVEYDGKEYVAEVFEEGKVVSTKDEDGNVVPLIEGSFEMDGNVITTDKDGIIISVVAKEAPETEETEEEEEYTKEEFKADLMVILDFNPEYMEVIKEIASEAEVEMSEEDIISKALELSEVKEKVSHLFEEDLKSREDKINTLTLKVEELESELERKPNDTKLKANKGDTRVAKLNETRLEALERIASNK